ncbi:MAG: hypothetical protein HGA42_14650, partial [Nostocales cyanobacterium W4_Combined_metabat2_030]|nr:hypothetical protein [Nostocales cyanobacterium W4_Combined_metabat2_030]
WTQDDQVPVITTEASSGDLGCNPDVEVPEFSGIDNCAGEFDPVVTSDGPTNDGCSYSQTWTATYTDACNNTAIPGSMCKLLIQELVLVFKIKTNFFKHLAKLMLLLPVNMVAQVWD